MNRFLLLAMILLSVVAEGEPRAECKSADGGVSLEVAVKITELVNVPEDRKPEILPKVLDELRTRMPFLTVVDADDQPHLIIELSVGETHYLRTEPDSGDQGETSEILSEPRAEIRVTKIHCQGLPREYKNCAGRVKVVQPFFWEMREIDPSDLDRVFAFFVDTLSRRLCEVYGGST